MDQSTSEVSAVRSGDTSPKSSITQQLGPHSRKLEAFFSTVKKSLQLQQETSSTRMTCDGATISTTNDESGSTSNQQQELPPPLMNEARSRTLHVGYVFLEPLKDEVIVDQQNSIYGRSSRIEESHPFFDGRFRETDDGFIDYDPDWAKKVDAAKEQRRRRRRVSAWGRNAAV